MDSLSLSDAWEKVMDPDTDFPRVEFPSGLIIALALEAEAMVESSERRVN